MTLNQTNKLVRIVETVRKVRKFSFEELHRRTNNLELRGGEEMQKCIFHEKSAIIFFNDFFFFFCIFERRSLLGEPYKYSTSDYMSIVTK